MRILSGKSAGTAIGEPVNFVYGKNRGKITAHRRQPQSALRLFHRGAFRGGHFLDGLGGKKNARREGADRRSLCVCQERRGIPVRGPFPPADLSLHPRGG